ncbi:MAG: hypothetical protein JST50_18565 [Bacteroidetes bacterium]|jgi:hypothetical protein|nr:hypothetical protein [Bacteroidota bacterium]
MSISYFLFLHIKIIQDITKKEPSHSLYDFAKDFFIPISIAVMAACIAYYIFIRETKRDKQNELNSRLTEQKDKLTYFTILIKRTLKISEIQKNFLKDYIRKIGADDINFHMINYVPIDDLRRIVENTNLEAYMLAYSNKFSFDRKAAIEQYQKISSNVDFLFSAFKGLMDQIRKAQDNDQERKITYKELFYSGYDILGEIEFKLRINKRWHDIFIGIRNNYFNSYVNDYDLNFFQNFYFVPFYKFCADYNSSNMPLIEELVNLEVTTSKGIHLFKHIKAENRRLKRDLIENFRRIAESIIDLKKISKPLLVDF